MESHAFITLQMKQTHGLISILFGSYAVRWKHETGPGEKEPT